MTKDYLLGFLTGLGAGLVACTLLSGQREVGALGGLLEMAGFALLLVGGVLTSLLRLKRHSQKPKA